MTRKYIDINGYVSLCNNIDKNNPIIECLTDNNPDEPLCDTAVRFPAGCVSLPWGYYYGGYYYGYYARTYGLTFMKISYDIPDSIRSKNIPGSRYLESNCGNDYDIGLVVPHIQWENYTYGCPLLGVGQWYYISVGYQEQLCKDAGAGTYVRTANCKRAGCPGNYLTPSIQVCQEKQGDLRLQTCCVGAEECGPEDEGCILIAARVEKTFEVDYEIVARAHLCAESIPEIPEKGCGSMTTAADSSYMRHNKCEHSGQEDCDPVTNSRGVSISHGCSSTSDDCPPNSPGPFWGLAEEFITSKTVQYEKKDCECTCSSCIKCDDLETDECLDFSWNGYVYGHNTTIGTNCCGPSVGWWWTYSICSSDAKPNDTPAENTGEPSCHEPAPNWVIVDACDTNLIEDYESRECFTRGDNFTRNYESVAPPPPSSSNECLKDSEDTEDPPPVTTREYASFKPKQCEMGLVEILRSRLVYQGAMPSNYRDYAACRSQIVAAAGYWWWLDRWCFPDFECEPAEELCYNNEQIFITWPYVYQPSEIVDTATATATVTYCKMSIKNCAPEEE